MNFIGIDKIFEKVGNVKLKGGVFGKLTWTIIVISICITTLALTTGNLYVLGGTIVLEAGFAYYFLNRLLDFTAKYPEIAILDGAEFLTHERILHASKNLGVLPAQANVADHPQTETDATTSDLEEVYTTPEIEMK